MRIVVPYVPGLLRVGTQVALGPQRGRYVDVSSSDTAYHDLLASLWDEPDDTLIVEQDMVPSDELITDVMRCHEDWCAAPYWTAGGQRYDCAFGFVRFSGYLMRHLPWIPAMAAVESKPVAARHWRRVDARWSAALESEGTVRHVHAPHGLRHLSPLGA